MGMHLPTVIAGWTLLKLMGEGAMGQVWKVHRLTAAGASVLAVMKLPLAGGVADPKAGHRWLGEAQILMKLQTCSHVVKVHDAGIDRGIYYIVMEYVHGTDLAQLLRLMRKADRPMPIPGAIWVGGQMMLGLGEIHGLVIANVAQKILHKDIAPKNTLVSVNGEVKLSDFGISTARDVKMTNAGTLRYMAIEQHEGEPTQRSDVYSNAVVMWEMLEMTPYRSGDADVVRRQIFSPNPRPLTRPGIQPGVSSLLMAALDPNEKNRPMAMEFVEGLEATGCYVPQERHIGGFVRTLASGVATSGQTELFENKQPERTPNLVGLLAARDDQLARGGIDTAAALAAARRRESGEHVAADAVDAAQPATIREFAAGPDPTPALVVRLVPVAVAPPGASRMPRTLPLPPAIGRGDESGPGRTALVFSPEPDAPSRTNPLPLALRGVPHELGEAPARWPRVDARPEQAVRPPDTAPEHEAVTTSAVVVTVTGPARLKRPTVLVSVAASVLLAIGGGGYALLTFLETPLGTPSSHASIAEATEERPRVSIAPTYEEPLLDPVLDEAQESPVLPNAMPATEAVLQPSQAEAEPVPASIAKAEVATAPPTRSVARPSDPAMDAPIPSRRKAAPAPPVNVTFYRDFIDGFDVKIGRKLFHVTTDHTVEIPAGRHRVRWLEHGATAWKDAGTIDFKAGMQHAVRVGAIGHDGFQHRAIAGKP